MKLKATTLQYEVALKAEQVPESSLTSKPRKQAEARYQDRGEELVVLLVSVHLCHFCLRLSLCRWCASVHRYGVARAHGNAGTVFGVLARGSYGQSSRNLSTILYAVLAQYLLRYTPSKTRAKQGTAGCEARSTPECCWFPGCFGFRSLSHRREVSHLAPLPTLQLDMCGPGPVLEVRVRCEWVI